MVELEVYVTDLAGRQPIFPASGRISTGIGVSSQECGGVEPNA
jgi:hypothetical protein